jgi:DNA-binding MarR family transcriptional regulator
VSDEVDLDSLIAVAEFRAALGQFLRRSELAARQSGLTPQRYLLLLMIKGAPDRSERTTVTDLSRRLHLAQSTVSELVHRAEETGLVEREPSDVDGRVAQLRLTVEGDRRLRECLTTLEAERHLLLEAVESLAYRARVTPQKPGGR